MLWPHILLECSAVCVVGLQGAKVDPPATEVPADAVTIAVSMKSPVFRADEQPAFIVTFRSKAKDYVNLDDAGAYWDWNVRFTEIDKRTGPDGPGPWRLSFDVANSMPVGMQQLLPGKSLDVPVDLNDPAFTFEYSYEGTVKHLVAPIRHLRPGRYRMELTVALKTPFGPGYHIWMGPASGGAVDFQVTPAPARPPTARQLEVWNKAIDAVFAIVKEPGGLWLNGSFPALDLPASASGADVVAMAVNRTILGSKAYRILLTRRFDGKSAALVIVGKQPKVVIFFFDTGIQRWWTRFYDASGVDASDASTPARNR